MIKYGTLVATALLFAGCQPRGAQKEFENFSPSVPASRFKTIATIASSSNRTDLQMSVQARETLQKQGFNAVRATGRWDAVSEMIAQVCGSGAERPVDGVLLVSYNHLVLYDCQSGKAAYEIQSSPESGGLSYRQSLDRLLTYLKTGRPSSTP